MSRNNRQYDPAQTMAIYLNRWRNHYRNYLSLLAYQLIEWENLPHSINPRYLEETLHTKGHIAYYRDKEIGDIVVQGAIYGRLNLYNEPVGYQASAVNYTKSFLLANYLDDDDPNKGVLIRNNDTMTSTVEAIEIFAEELAQLKAITRVNLNAQKTPFMMGVDDNDKLTLLNVYNQIEMNAPAILFTKDFDKDKIAVFNTPAPYVADKLNTQRINIWNEFMTYLGIDNANVEKKERLITSEVNANTDQTANSSNILLKSRKEAVEIINSLYGLNIKVKLRSEVVDKIKSEVENENG